MLSRPPPRRSSTRVPSRRTWPPLKQFQQRNKNKKLCAGAVSNFGSYFFSWVTKTIECIFYGVTFYFGNFGRFFFSYYFLLSFYSSIMGPLCWENSKEIRWSFAMMQGIWFIRYCYTEKVSLGRVQEKRRKYAKKKLCSTRNCVKTMAWTRKKKCARWATS